MREPDMDTLVRCPDCGRNEEPICPRCNDERRIPYGDLADWEQRDILREWADEDRAERARQMEDYCYADEV